MQFLMPRGAHYAEGYGLHDKVTGRVLFLKPCLHPRRCRSRHCRSSRWGCWHLLAFVGISNCVLQMIVDLIQITFGRRRHGTVFMVLFHRVGSVVMMGYVTTLNSVTRVLLVFCHLYLLNYSSPSSEALAFLFSPSKGITVLSFITATTPPG